MASYSYTFTSGDVVTPTKLNNARTVSDIVNADISATAGIAGSKLEDGAITNAKVNAAAAIADSKLATISTAGKVSGDAITSGTIGGSTAITTTGTVTAGKLIPTANTSAGNGMYLVAANTLAFSVGGAEEMRMSSGRVGIGKNNPAYQLDVGGGVNTSTDFRVNGTKVVDSRRTGWSAATGTATRTAFDTSTVTTQELAERVKALIDDLRTHGLIGN